MPHVPRHVEHRHPAAAEEEVRDLSGAGVSCSPADLQFLRGAQAGSSVGQIQVAPSVKTARCTHYI